MHRKLLGVAVLLLLTLPALAGEISGSIIPGVPRSGPSHRVVADVDGWPQDKFLEDGTPLLDALLQGRISAIYYEAEFDAEKLAELKAMLPASACNSARDCAEKVEDNCIDEGVKVATVTFIAASGTCSGTCDDGRAVSVHCY